MRINVDSRYNARADFLIIGYMGETNARTITFEGLEVDGADLYKMQIKYADGNIYELDITDSSATLGASVYRQAGYVTCQILACKSVGDTYTLVKKSNLFRLKIGASNEEGGIPTYEQSIEALDKVLAYESQSKEYAERAENAASRAEDAQADISVKAQTVEDNTKQAAQAADIAVQSANKAEQMSQSAEQSAASASKSADTAGLAADNAGTSAQTASTAAEQAKSSADTAASYSTTAGGYARTASESADNAANSAAGAANAADNASKSATAAKTAQAAAESARDTAVQAQADVATKSRQVSDNAAQVAKDRQTVTQDKTAAETAATTCESISQMMSDYASPLYIKPTVEGSNIMIEDSGNAPIQGLTLYGKSTQDGTPTPDNPVDIISVDNPTITVTDNGDNTQTAQINHTLRGIPVSSGGNYTDSTGQQWVCDTLTVNADGSGELIQRVGLEVMSNVVTTALPNNDNIFTIKGSVSNGYLQGKASLTQYRLLCSCFTTSEKRFVTSSSPNNSMTWSGSPDQQLRVGTTMGVDALTELLNNGNVVLQYILAAPITTDLTPEEVQSILSLQTYKPLTNISNDKSADMSVTYVADSKTYIDNKFAELSAAIISSASEVD